MERVVNNIIYLVLYIGRYLTAPSVDIINAQFPVLLWLPMFACSAVLDAPCVGEEREQG